MKLVERMPRVWKQRVATLKNLKYKIYFDLFNTFLVTTVVAKGFENDTNIHFHKVCCLSLYDGKFAYTPECYEEWSDELQLIAKSLFAMQMNWISPKFPLYFSPATKGPTDIMSVWKQEITLSCWLSSNNRLESSKGGWCLESLFFLCQPWLPARKHVPSSLLCTKKGFRKGYCCQ